jgi:phosphoserine phosphatase RsbU/P
MKKILIIEDDQVVSSIYRNKYQMGGFSVEIAKDGEEGLVKLEAFQPDIVQLDLMMPKLNGVEVIKRIRAHPKFATLPVVVLSNSYLAHMVTEAWQAGANRCISKADCTPKTMMEIVDRLRRRLRCCRWRPVRWDRMSGFRKRLPQRPMWSFRRSCAPLLWTVPAKP